MNEKKIPIAYLTDRILDALDEHGINKIDQAASLCIALVRICHKMKYTKGDSIDLLISTYDAYDRSDTKSS